jgi:serine/threonine protein kinase
MRPSGDATLPAGGAPPETDGLDGLGDTITAGGDALAFKSAASPTNTIELDRYVFGREIDRGGIGRIRVAFDRRLEHKVAVKELLVARPGSVQEARFIQEARLTAQLQHPSIIAVSDLGRRPDGVPFFCMKLVDGRSLAALIAETEHLSQRLALLRHVYDVADAMAYAHVQGVIHRDLKPANVLVGPFGESVVIDWGLAKRVSDSAYERSLVIDTEGSTPTSPELTGDGEIMGTLAYMPPEQASGDPVDERADVYALGAMLYHVLSGTPPHHGNSVRSLLLAVKALHVSRC